MNKEITCDIHGDTNNIFECRVDGEILERLCALCVLTFLGNISHPSLDCSPLKNYYKQPIKEKTNDE